MIMTTKRMLNITISRLLPVPEIAFWAEAILVIKEVNTGWQHANLVRCVRTLSDDGLYEADKFYQYSDNIFTLTRFDCNQRDYRNYRYPFGA